MSFGIKYLKGCSEMLLRLLCFSPSQGCPLVIAHLINRFQLATTASYEFLSIQKGVISNYEFRRLMNVK